jgi:hypothetical protein
MRQTLSVGRPLRWRTLLRVRLAMVGGGSIPLFYPHERACGFSSL